MRKGILVFVALIVVTVGYQLGSKYLSGRAAARKVSPVIITGSFSPEAAQTGAQGVPAAQTDRYRTATWGELMPDDWNPVKIIGDLNIDDLDDSDPRAIEALQKTMDAWKNAPVEPGMNDQDIRIGGYVVPLEHQGAALKEFLLVPYYGACIHTPPPPPNQIILVTLQRPVRNVATMDAVWVAGNLQVEKKETIHGPAGYTLQGVSVVAYVPETKGSD